MSEIVAGAGAGAEAIGAWEDEGGAAATGAPSTIIGTISQVEWAGRIKSRVNDEFNRVSRSFRDVASKQNAAKRAVAIALAQAVARVHPETIRYIETHGTATPLGDPIEIAALTQVFRARTKRKAICAIGSVKSNVGHLKAAAGVTGLIKTVLALENEELPLDLVTLNSRVHIRDLDTGKEMVCSVVFPKDSYVSADRLSVLAPIGTAAG